jgi:hypothetical protein
LVTERPKKTIRETCFFVLDTLTSPISKSRRSVLTIPIEQEGCDFVCTIMASESAEGKQRMVKALRWLLEDSRRDREVA